MDMNSIAKAASIVGSRQELAKLLGVTKGAVWQWEHERQVPAERCIDIERATAGAVTCEELRPDLADRWAYLRGTQKEAA